MQRFSWPLAFRLATSSFGIALIGPIFASYVPILLAGFGLSAFAVGFLGGLDSYGSLLLLPAIAALSDRTLTRLGRRRPFMLVGAPLTAISFIALPHMPSLPALLLAMLGTVAGLALLRGPNAALLGDLFPSASRSRASGVINLLGGISWVVAFGAGGALYRLDPALPFLVMAFIMLVCVTFVMLTIREPAAPSAPMAATNHPALTDPGLRRALRSLLAPGDRSLPAILGALLMLTAGIIAVGNFFTLYCRNVLGIDPGSATQLLGLYAASGVLAAIPVGLLSGRFGRRFTTAIGFAALLVLFALAYFASDVPTIAVLLFLAGIASTPGSVNFIPMVLDAAPTRDSGTYVGLTYVFGALGGILGPLLAGLLIDVTGDYRALFLFGPLAMLAGLLLVLYARTGEARV